MFSLYPFRDELRILWGPNRLHQLSGPVVTPLFKHLGLSSWHEADGAFFKKLSKQRSERAALLYIFIAGFIICILANWYNVWERRRTRTVKKSKMDEVAFV
jgi:hypothetical protein